MTLAEFKAVTVDINSPNIDVLLSTGIWLVNCLWEPMPRVPQVDIVVLLPKTDRPVYVPLRNVVAVMRSRDG
jgi:hypothetical protein